MRLSEYDGKCVQIKCIDGKIYEGICSYNCRDYCYHEFGRNEDSLQIFHFLFYKNDIEKIMVVTDFSEPYGEIEKETFKDDALLEQALDDEDDIHVYRLLCYMETVLINDKIIRLLKNLIKYNVNKKIVNKAKDLIKRKEL